MLASVVAANCFSYITLTFGTFVTTLCGQRAKLEPRLSSVSLYQLIIRIRR